MVNGTGSPREQFSVAWAGAEKPRAATKAVSVHVPAGQSRVIRVERPPGDSGDRLILQGDGSAFDDTLYVPPLRSAQARVVYIGGDDPRDPQGLLYYLQLALGQSAGERVTVAAQSPEDSLDHLQSDPPRLVVASVGVPAAARLQAYVDAGGVLLIVPARARPPRR